MTMLTLATCGWVSMGRECLLSYDNAFPIDTDPVGGFYDSKISKVLVGDLNSDGRDDLVLFGRGGDLSATRTVETLLGTLNGDGTTHFSSANTYDDTYPLVADEAYPFLADVVPVGGDGNADVVYVENVGGTVVALRGNGGGALGTPVTMFTASQIIIVAKARLSGGKDELVVVYREAGGGYAVGVVTDGGGGVQRILLDSPFPPEYPDSFDRSANIAVGDWDRDGKEDLVVVTPFHLGWYRGNGTGLLGSAPTAVANIPLQAPTTVDPPWVVMAKTNPTSDRPVVYVSDAQVGVIFAYKLLSSGRIRAPTTIPTSQDARPVTFADVNGDDALDLITTLGGGRIFLNRGDGGSFFAAFQFRDDPPTLDRWDPSSDARQENNDEPPTPAHVLSFNPLPDTAFAYRAKSGEGPRLSILYDNLGSLEVERAIREDGVGSTAPFERAGVLQTNAQEISALVGRDMDFDGEIDLVYLDVEARSLSVHFSSGPNVYQGSPQVIELDSDASSMDVIRASDTLSGDGLSVQSGLVQYTVNALSREMTSAFDPTPAGIPATAFLTSVVARFRQQAREDTLLAVVDTDGLNGLSLYVGVSEECNSCLADTGAVNMELADVNGNGRDLDVVLATSSGGHGVCVFEYLSPIPGSIFAAPVCLSALPTSSLWINSLIVLDMDGDGYDEVGVVKTDGALTIATRQSGNPLVYTSLQTMTIDIGPPPAPPVTLLAANLLGDSKPEMLVATFGSTSTRLFVCAVNSGTFPANANQCTEFTSTILRVGSPISQVLAVADIDKDGFLDPIVGYGSQIVWYNIVPNLSYTPTVPRVVAQRWDEVDGGTGEYPLGYLVAELESASPCWTTLAELPATGVVGGCFSGVPQYALNSPLILRGAENGTSRVDCSVLSPEGLFFEVAQQTRVEFTGFELRGASSSSRVANTLTAVSPIRVAGPSASLVMERVNVTSCAAVVTGNLMLFEARGGAVSVSSQGTLLVYDSSFTHNVAGNAGGALLLAGVSEVHLARTVFESNTALGLESGAFGGGAIAISGAGSVSVEDCVFDGNVARRGSGGAILFGSLADPKSRVEGSTFANNVAGVAGGAVRTFGQSDNGNTFRTFAGCNFTANQAMWGGAMALTQMKTQELPGPDVGSPLSRLPTRADDDAGNEPRVEIVTGSVFHDNVGVYGGVYFLDRIVVNETQVCQYAGNRAERGGGFGWMLVEEGGLSGLEEAFVGESLRRFGGDGGDGGEFEVENGWGRVLASSPARVRVVDGFPERGMSGVALGAGQVEVLDWLENRIRDPSLVVTATVGSSGVAAVVDVTDVGVVIDGETGLAEVGADLVIRLVDWAGETTGGRVETLITAVGGDVDDVGLMVEVSACQPGYGRASGVDEPLQCQVCVAGTKSPPGVGTTVEPCIVVLACGGDTRQVGDVCEACPVNTRVASGAGNTSIAGEDEVCVCKSGFWSPSGEDGVACEPCPRGGICSGGLGAGPPKAGPGFFPAEESGVFVQCPVAEACVGNGGCAEGYRSRLCGQCAEGWYLLNGKCRRCDQSRTGLVVVLVLVACLVGISGLVWLALSTDVHLGHKYIKTFNLQPPSSWRHDRRTRTHES